MAVTAAATSGPASRPLPTRGGGNREKSAKKKKQESIWDERFVPLVNYMLSMNAVRIRPAVEVGRKAVEYFRAQDFSRWILDEQDTLRSKFPECFKNSSTPMRIEDVAELAQELVRLGFIYRAEYQPISCAAPSSSDSAPSSVDAPKWPKRLAISPKQFFEPNGFYVIVYEPPSSWQYVLLALMIGAVLAVCMFPAWPLGLKLFTWYTSVILMTFVLGSVVLRLVVFVIIWFFGVDFWVFPNFFDEELGVIDSFHPLYSFEYRKDGWIMVAARLALALLTGACFYQLSQTHSLSDAHRFATRQFLDVLDWGHQKLAAPPGQVSVPAAPKGLRTETIDGKDSAAATPIDVSCLKLCGFQDYDTLKAECLEDCDCLQELSDTPCLKKCSSSVQGIIQDALHMTCDNNVFLRDDGDNQAIDATSPLSGEAGDEL